jgi:glycosyltransferase involved in cell wall biosynthesis
MKRIIFLNRFFYPDYSATSQVLSSLAFHLAECGNDVHLITSRQLYNDSRAEQPAETFYRGVHIHRVFSTRYGRGALLGRGFDYSSFYASMWLCATKLSGKNDIVISKTDPPLTSVLAMRVARRQGARLVNWLQDIYPEVAVRLGVPFLRGPVGWGLCRFRDASLKFADANVVVGDYMAEEVIKRGASPDLVHVIPNWVDETNMVPVGQIDNPLRHEWGLEGQFVVGYSGNLGRAHEFDTILGAIDRLRGTPSTVFLFIGGGHRFDELAKIIEARGLKEMVRFAPYQDAARLKYSLSVPDVHWISLRPELEGFIVPSKFYGIAAVGRPVIAITAVDGEIARLVRRYECGVVVEPGDVDALVRNLHHLRRDVRYTRVLGARARQMLEAHFTERQAFRRWRELLERIG